MALAHGARLLAPSMVNSGQVRYFPTWSGFYRQPRCGVVHFPVVVFASSILEKPAMNERRLVRCQLGVLFLLIGMALVAFGALVWQSPATAQTQAAQTPQPLERPPEGQTYVGARNCSACHFDQFLDWRSTKHSKAFEALPAKYRTDFSCLKCHVTGLGETGGFKTAATTPDLVGASCESCHGPGSEHVNIAKKYADKKLSDAEDAYVRSTIHRMQPKNVCVECHLTRAHQKHPPYTK
jgi:hypothetical protein